MFNIELTSFTLRYLLSLLIIKSYTCIVNFDQKTIRQVNKIRKMDNKLLSLKLKLHIFSSVDSDQRLDQQQMPIKDRNDRTSIGLTIRICSLTIRRNSYYMKIKPADFREPMRKPKQFLYWEDRTRRGEGKYLNQTNKPNLVMRHTPRKNHTVHLTPTTSHVG